MLLLAGCRSCHAPNERSSEGVASAVAQQVQHVALPAAPLPSNATLPLFADDTADPYNGLHALLFATKDTIPSSACDGLDGGCENEPVTAIVARRATSRVPQYADRIIINVEIGDALRLVGRTPAIADAVRRAEAIDPRSRPMAALLLQHDVWAVYDALVAAHDASADPLRDLLGSAIKALALPASSIRALGPSFDDALRAHPEVVRGVHAEDLVELVSEEVDNPGDTATVTTTHARLRALRSIFRRFVRAPGGPQAVRELLRLSPASVPLPEGSVAVIVETPLAVSSEGELVAPSLVTLLEARRVVALPTEPTIAQLGFDVLEGSRRSLRAVPPSFDLIRPSAPFPANGSCGHDFGQLVPMRTSCVTCHGVRGALVASFVHGESRFREAQPFEAAEAVLRGKSKRAEFLALRRFFAER
jgi:hypothetical protein